MLDGLEAAGWFLGVLAGAPTVLPKLVSRMVRSSMSTVGSSAKLPWLAAHTLRPKLASKMVR